jgi:Spy/CpxP family protein refolding chaperone
MNGLTRTKVIAYLAVIFVAGGVTGAVLVRNDRDHPSRPSPEKFCRKVRDRLQSELSLTPAQVAKLDPLLEKQARRMEEIRTQTVQQLNELIRTSNLEIADVLNLSPEQRSKLDAMEKKRQEFMGKHPGRGPSSSRPPPQ